MDNRKASKFNITKFISEIGNLGRSHFGLDYDRIIDDMRAADPLPGETARPRGQKSVQFADAVRLNK